MDFVVPKLSTILTSVELEEIRSHVREKLEAWIDGFSANQLGLNEQKTEHLKLLIQDLEGKLESQNINVTELRAQLDSVSAERVQLLEQCNNYDRDVVNLRNEKNGIAEEHDSLLTIIERQKSKLERLRDDLLSYQQQLNSAISAKCEAIARVDEIESQKVALDFKENYMEQERAMLLNEIRTLKDDLNRKISELQNIGHENAIQNMHLEAQLNEKAEELKISQAQCCEFEEKIDQLTQNTQDLSAKLLNKNEERNQLMDYYRKELDAKTKLTHLYRKSFEDLENERNELTITITDQKRKLAEANQQYGDIETEFEATIVQHKKELKERDKLIEEQKTELLHVNESLKKVQHETIESVISKMAPSAALACRLIQPDISLTELYLLYIKTFDALELQKRENARINLQLTNISQELGKSAAIIKENKLEYEKLVEANNILAQQQHELLSKKVEIEEELENVNNMEREFKHLKRSNLDLSRQVCCLLFKIEGDAAQAENDKIISKKLVTFQNLNELQANNQNLLLLIQDLRSQSEDAETLKQVETAAWNEKKEAYVKNIQSLHDTINQQNSTIATLISKCERYQKMFYDLHKKYTQSASEMDKANDHENGEFIITSNKSKKANDLNTERHIRDLEHQLQDVKEQYENYIEEKKNNDRIMNEEFDSMRQKVRELTSTNCQLKSALECSKEQRKLQQNNISSFRQQISALEVRSKNYETIIIKHEETVLFLKNEVMKAQYGHTASQTEASHLRCENHILKDTVNRLCAEKEGYNREQQTQNLLLNNLEIIKSNLERSEMEGKALLEQRLDEAVRELSTQRRRFQEEVDHFHETTLELKRQTESAIKAMEAEKTQADKLHAELLLAREEITLKSKEIDALSRKLQNSLTPENDNSISLSIKKARNFELIYEEAKIHIASLNNELITAKEHAEQNLKVAQDAEVEIRNMRNIHTEYRAKAVSEINELKMNEVNLKSRVSELETEVQIANITQRSTASTQSNHIEKTQEEIRSLVQKLSENLHNLRSLRSENATLSESLNNLEAKYANEILMHSVDIQELAKVRSEIAKKQKQIHELITERDSAKELKCSHERSNRLLQSEMEEQEKRIANLNSLNSNLHTHIETLTMNLSIQNQNNSSSSGTLNASVMEISGTKLSRSRVDDDSKNCNQLLQIIKYIRKEKDFSEAKLDILKAENLRLQSENTMLQKKITELEGAQERANSGTSVVFTANQEEILRKIEILNAITDSNRTLREEHNFMAARLKELNENISKTENELISQKNKNQELMTKIEELSTENTSLSAKPTKWHQPANVLLKKSCKEEFKRLQSEREDLSKLISNQKQMNQITRELNTHNAEKLQLGTEIALLQKQVQVLTDEKKKIENDYAALRQNNSRIMQESMELKNKMLQKEGFLQKLTDDLEAKEAQLHDSKIKETQIRKIAKKYKTSFMELFNKTSTPAYGSGTSASESMELVGSNTEDNTVHAATNNDLEQNRITIESLRTLLSTVQEENKKNRKDYDELRASMDTEGRAAVELRDAKARILCIAQDQNAIAQELTTTKNRPQEFEQFTDNTDSTIRRYEGTLTRKKTELVEQSNRSKEWIARLTAENKFLRIRINQLSQQRELQHTTSSVEITEISGTSQTSLTENLKTIFDSETTLTSIRPLSLQNRTTAILPSTGTFSSSATTASTICSDIAIVPLQQPIQIIGSSTVEDMSSCPSSFQTDYMPSTSSAPAAVAMIPSMVSIYAAKSSQEAVSLPRNNELSNTASTTSSSTNIAVSTHSLRTQPSSSVAITQSGTSGSHKRRRELEGDSSGNVDDSASDKPRKLPKRSRGGEITMAVVKSKEVVYEIIKIDDDPTERDTEHKGYGDSCEQDQDVDKIQKCEVNETNRVYSEEYNNKVLINEENGNHAQCISGTVNQSEVHCTTGASPDQAAAEALEKSIQMDSHPERQIISNGSYGSNANIVKPTVIPLEQSSILTHVANIRVICDHDPSGSRSSDKSNVEILSSHEDSKSGFPETIIQSVENENKVAEDEAGAENTATDKFDSFSDASKKTSSGASEDIEESKTIRGEFAKESAAVEISENIDSESYHSSGAVQSEPQNIEGIQDKAMSQSNKRADKVQEGREDEASTFSTINTRSKASKAGALPKHSRGFHRGRSSKPIIRQDYSPRNINLHQVHGQDPGTPIRGILNRRSPQDSGIPIRGALNRRSPQDSGIPIRGNLNRLSPQDSGISIRGNLNRRSPQDGTPNGGFQNWRSQSDFGSPTQGLWNRSFEQDRTSPTRGFPNRRSQRGRRMRRSTRSNRFPF